MYLICACCLLQMKALCIMSSYRPSVSVRLLHTSMIEMQCVFVHTRESEGWSEQKLSFIIAKLFCQAEHTEETKLSLEADSKESNQC